VSGSPEKASVNGTVLKLGQCLALNGEGREVSVDTRDCSDAPFRISQITTFPDRCVPDRDTTYFWSDRTKGSHVTLCLDINWRSGQCVAVTDTDVRSVACGDRSVVDRQTPIQIVDTRSSTVECDRKSGRVYAYPNRNFAVCTKLVQP
jgi:hypothetical protein